MPKDDWLTQFLSYISNAYILFAEFPTNILALTSATTTRTTTDACKSFQII